MSVEETEEIAANFNQKAMSCLESNNFNNALSLLHQASYLLKNKKLTEAVIRLKCITLNNLGCVYKRLERPKKALQFLNEALSLGYKFSTEVDMAGIHLNICAIKSLLSAHEEALFHALKGLKIAQQVFTIDSKNIHTVLSGYFQSAHEYVFLHKNKEAAKYFTHGYDLACTHLGRSHFTTSKFYKAMHDKGLKDFTKISLKQHNSKVLLKPIESNKIVHSGHRSEVKSTEPLKKYKIHRQHQSVSISPLQKLSDKAKSIIIASEKPRESPSPLAHNIKYIGNALNIMQRRLDLYSKKTKGLGKIQSDSESSYSTPRAVGLKRYHAAIIIQKNLRMWKCRKKYRYTRNCIKKIQRAVREFRYYKYLAREKNKFGCFSQQFNKNILEEHWRDVRSRMISTDVQTSLDFTVREFQYGYFPQSKEGQLYRTIRVIQKYIRRFLAKKKVNTRKRSLIIIQKNIRMHLQLNKYRNYIKEKRWIEAQNKAAVTIQRNARMCIQRKQYLLYLKDKRLSEKKYNAAVTIQKNARMVSEYKKFYAFRRAIQKLQLVFRSYKAKTAPQVPTLDNVIVRSKREWL